MNTVSATSVKCRSRSAEYKANIALNCAGIETVVGAPPLTLLIAIFGIWHFGTKFVSHKHLRNLGCYLHWNLKVLALNEH